MPDNNNSTNPQNPINTNQNQVYNTQNHGYGQNGYQNPTQYSHENNSQNQNSNPAQNNPQYPTLNNNFTQIKSPGQYTKFSPSTLSQLQNLRNPSSNPQNSNQSRQNTTNQGYGQNDYQNPTQYSQENNSQNQTTNQPINNDFGISFEQPAIINPDEPNQNPNPKNKVKGNLNNLLNILKKIAIGLLVLALLAGIGAGAYLYLNKTAITIPINIENIKGVITAPPSLAQGTVGTWKIKISNNQSYPIDDVQLEMKYDQDFQTTNFPNYKPINGSSNNVFNIGKLDQFGVGTQEAVVDIEGFVNAQVDIETTMSGKMSFYPIRENGIKSEQKIEIPIAVAKTKVTSPEIQLTITPTIGSVQNGGEAEFIIKVKNTKENDYQDLRLRIGYPAGNIFTYQSSQFTASNTSQKITTPSDGDDTWYISRLAGLSEQTLTIKGKVAVKSEQKVPLKVTLAKKNNDTDYKDLKTSIKDILVTNQPIVITTSLEKSEKTFTAGENLKVVIDYFNQSQETLKNVEILGFINDKSNLLDLNSISFSGGNRAFINNSQIQWTGNNTPQLVSLSPQSKGQLTYSINVKKDLLKETKNQSEYVLTPQVQIKAVNLQEITTSGQEYKMNSSLRFTQTETKEINIEKNTNTSRKRYRLQWELGNDQNQINNIIIKTRTSLPPTALIRETITKPEGSEFDYNPSSGEIIFKLDQVPAYTGLDPKKPLIKISFEFEIDQQSTRLIEAPVLTANDDFTGDTFNITGKESETQN